MHKTVRIIYLETRKSYIEYTLTWISKAEQLSSFLSKEKLNKYLKQKIKATEKIKAINNKLIELQKK